MIAKRAKPEVRLGPLVLAAMLADLLWLAFMAGGIESIEVRPGRGIEAIASAHIPWSHSLLMVAAWGGVLAFLAGRQWVVFAAALSHWFLDWIAHPPVDLVLAPGLDRHFGLGLWTSIPSTLVVEGGLWVAAVAAYIVATKARSRSGSWGFWIGAVLLTLLWLANLRSGPTAPNLVSEAISFAIFGSFVAWGYWMDRARANP